MKKIIIVALVLFFGCSHEKYVMDSNGINYSKSRIKKRTDIAKDLMSNGDTLCTDFKSGAMYLIRIAKKDTLYLVTEEQVKKIENQ